MSGPLQIPKPISLERACESIRAGYWGDAEPSAARSTRVRVVRNGDIDRNGDLTGAADRWFSGKEAERARVVLGDVLLTTSGQIGKTHLATELGYHTSNFVRRLRPNQQEVLPRFLYHMLHSREAADRMNEHSAGSTMSNLKAAFYKAEWMPCPPVPKQERIVAILDEAFAAIATATANGDRKLTSANALWTAMLDSGCSGALTTRWRQESGVVEPAEGLLARTIDRRRAQSNTPGRSKEPQPPVAVTKTTISDTWVWASPEQLSTHIVDCPHSTPTWADEGLICLRTTNFRPGHLDLSSVRYVSDATYTERTKRLEPRPGDVTYSREGGILGIACVLPGGLKACLGQRMMLFRLDESVVHPRYFAYVLNSTHILAIVNRLTAGAAAPHINIRDIRRFPIPLPPLSEQQQIVTALDTAWTSTQRLERTQLRKLALLTDLKQSILHKAFTGELTADPNAVDRSLSEAGV